MNTKLPVKNYLPSCHESSFMTYYRLLESSTALYPFRKPYTTIGLLNNVRGTSYWRHSAETQETIDGIMTRKYYNDWKE